jgi:hypothetical protein
MDNIAANYELEEIKRFEDVTWMNYIRK